VEGKEKLAVDLPLSVKKKLSDMAHNNRTTMTNMVIKLIEDAAKK
jgi:macrodomain Ter protein organizer (MatP/YcbG family)